MSQQVNIRQIAETSKKNFNLPRRVSGYISRRQITARNMSLYPQARRVFTCLGSRKLYFIGHVLLEHVKHGIKSTLEEKRTRKINFKFLTSVYHFSVKSCRNGSLQRVITRGHSPLNMSSAHIKPVFLYRLES